MVVRLVVAFSSCLDLAFCSLRHPGIFYDMYMYVVLHVRNIVHVCTIIKFLIRALLGSCLGFSVCYVCVVHCVGRPSLF